MYIFTHTKRRYCNLATSREYQSPSKGFVKNNLDIQTLIDTIKQMLNRFDKNKKNWLMA
jgi:hypothetical protein